MTDEVNLVRQKSTSPTATRSPLPKGEGIFTAKMSGTPLSGCPYDVY